MAIERAPNRVLCCLSLFGRMHCFRGFVRSRPRLESHWRGFSDVAARARVVFSLRWHSVLGDSFRVAFRDDFDLDSRGWAGDFCFSFSSAHDELDCIIYL